MMVRGRAGATFRVQLRELWRRFWSRACLDCGHVYPSEQNPAGAPPAPDCLCCAVNH